MNITKRPNGTYQIREMHNGKRYTVTVKYKPTQKEAAELIQDRINNVVEKISTLDSAISTYIESKSNVLSPATLRAYESMRKNLPEWFAQTDLTEIDNLTMQKFVNELTTTHTAKYVFNVYGLCTSTIRFFIPDSTVRATLPKKPRTESYTPSVDDVRKLFEYAKGSEYYVALRLASMSLRRGEILALTLDDLDGDFLTINKSKVQDKDHNWVVKPTPKTDASNRTIAIPHDLAERIRKQGYIYRLNGNAIDNYLRRALPKLGIPMFSLHKLRHFFASYSHELGYSDAQIQEIGGWETDAVMKSIYRHAMSKDEAKKTMASDFDF